MLFVKLVAAPPIKRTELPSVAWDHLAINLCGGPIPSGHNLLVLVDYSSSFIEVEIKTKTD